MSNNFSLIFGISKCLNNKKWKKKLQLKIQKIKKIPKILISKIHGLNLPISLFVSLVRHNLPIRKTSFLNWSKLNIWRIMYSLSEFSHQQFFPAWSLIKLSKNLSERHTMRNPPLLQKFTVLICHNKEQKISWTVL